MKGFEGLGGKWRSSIVTTSAMHMYRLTGKDEGIGILRVVRLDVITEFR